MEKIDFLAGNEKRFADFKGKLNEGKMALISHVADLDGIAAAKIANKVLNADFLKFVDYYEINDDLVKELKKQKVKFVVFTDIHISSSEIIKKIEKFADVLIIDHHPFTEDLNSDKTVFINAQGYCAAYLCYYLFSKVINLDKLDWLAACASVSDWMFFKNVEFMSATYKKHGDKFIGDEEGIKKSDKFWDLQDKLSLAILYFRSKNNVKSVYDSIGESFGEISDLGKYAREVESEVNSAVEKFNIEKENIHDRIFWHFKMEKYPVKSIVINKISSMIKNKTIIIVMDDPKGHKISARRSNGGENVDELLKKLTSGMKNSNGGGHFKAAGGFVSFEDYQEFRKRLSVL